MPQNRAYYKNALICIHLLQKESIVESRSYFEGHNTPTRALGEMFLTRADELVEHGRHPYFRIMAAHRHLFNTLPDEQVIKAATEAWLRRVYNGQMGGIIKATLALAAHAKMSALGGNKLAEEVADAADFVFNSTAIMNAVIAFFGMRTKWTVIAEALTASGKERWADADESVFVFPEEDDPDSGAEGPTLTDVKSALGIDVDDESEQADGEAGGDAVSADPPSDDDILAAFPGIKKRVKPSNN